MRLPNLTIAQQLAQMRRDFDLSRVWAGGVDAFIESDRRAAQGFEGHRAGDVSQAHNSFGSM